LSEDSVNLLFEKSAEVINNVTEAGH